MTPYRSVLHPPLQIASDELAKAEANMHAARSERMMAFRAARPAAPADTAVVSLDTVSANGMFDAYVYVRLRGAAAETRLLVDSGNTCLIIPHDPVMDAAPYETLIGDVDLKEPWGQKAKLVRGPIDIAAENNQTAVLENCVFYAVTEKTADRTANFGIGCVSRWQTAMDPATNAQYETRAALTYSPDYAFAEVRLTEDLLSLTSSAKVTHGKSSLILHKSEPEGFFMMNILEDCYWMALIPSSLAIGGTQVSWPGEAFDPQAVQPIAMIDTGGTWPYLSDPNRKIPENLPGSSTSLPDWIPHGSRPSKECVSFQAAIAIGLSDKDGRKFSYSIDPAIVPDDGGLTLIRCDSCGYMMDQYGMNIGGLSCLCLDVLIDYSSKRVGFKVKRPIE
jgi:hypothetical protein